MRSSSTLRRLLSVGLASAFAALTMLVGTAAPAQAAPGSANEAATVVRSCAGAKQIKPRNLTSIYCGDMGVYVTGITWIGWTDDWAAGHGIEHRKLCKPNCATGGIATRPVGVLLSAPRKGNFTRVALYSSVTAPPSTLRLTGHVPR